VAGLDEEGNWLWTAQTDSRLALDLLGAEFDPKGNLRVTGSCSGEMSFGALSP